MIKVQKFIFNPFQENSYLLYDESGECILVDMGSYTVDEKKEVLYFIENNRLEPVKIVNTHCHVDHILGNSFFKNKFNARTAAHAGDESLLGNAVEHGEMFGFEVEEPPPLDEYLEEGKRLSFGTSFLDVFHVPGHSPGSVALYSPEDAFVLAGDVLFSGSIGRTDLPGGDYETLIKSIREKLFVLPPEVVVYCGHGPETTIGDEKESNPFLNS
ncbi:MAG: MBL fold metallo-hydrolase [Bacteroidales bacterium]